MGVRIEAVERERHIGEQKAVPQTREWQRQLEDRLGTKVQFQKLGERGKIVVEFYSEEELRGILDKLIREV